MKSSDIEAFTKELNHYLNIYNLINKSDNQLSFDEVLRIKNHKENLSQILKNKNETEAQNKNKTINNIDKKTMLEQRNFTNSLNSSLLMNKKNNKHLEFNIFPLEVKSHLLNTSFKKDDNSMNNFTNNENITKNNDKLVSLNLEEVLNDKISKQKAEKQNLNKEKKQSSSNEYLHNKFEIYENDNNEAYLDKYKVTKHNNNNSSSSVQNKKLKKAEKLVVNDLNYVDLLERDKQNFAKYDKMVTICISLAIMGFLMVLFLGGILFMYINTNTNRISKSTN